MIKKRALTAILAVSAMAFLAVAVWTYSQLLPFKNELRELSEAPKKPIFLDRHGERLNITYENRWNRYDRVKLHDVPELLQKAVVFSEDGRFFSHDGVDWLARLHALWQNLAAFDTVRGASTISEQVVRMIHPRPRTLGSRWVEGFEAMDLEKTFSKLEILEFYLNQVPYQGRRRGVVQAARYYFDRDIDTLSPKEMLALAVLVRSPKWLDPAIHPDRLDRAITRLLQRMHENARVSEREFTQIREEKLALRRSGLGVNAHHFIEFVSQKLQLDRNNDAVIHTTLDAQLQRSIQNILDSRLDSLTSKNVSNGAVLVIDHHTNEILAWVVAYAGRKDKSFNRMNPVVIRRQPGSALKPFLYAKAIEKGWTAATLIDDTPLQEGVGLGMHTYHNYSRGHYGLISVREALGNSLNIPAIKAIQYIGAETFLDFLHSLGISSLSGHPNVYGDGIALGNGELTLYELTQAYTVLARMGDYKAIGFIEEPAYSHPNTRVFSEEISSLIADILSDPAAREKEFGWNSILNLPYQTAVKTGTSNDYKDAWSMGFNDRYTVGVWFGNLDYRSMHKVTGSAGPAYVLRTVFSELNKNRQIGKLYLSPRLIKKRICAETGEPAHDDCSTRDELFVRGMLPGRTPTTPQEIRLRKPTNGLMMAMDPRIPDDAEYFSFELAENDAIAKVHWYVDGNLVGVTQTPDFHWKLKKGRFVAKAEVWLRDQNRPYITKEVGFTVQ
jgi:penicillin-binding protein 1C